MAITRTQAKIQYEYAKKEGWIDHFIHAAGVYGFEPSLLMAIASRETNMRNIRGDYRGGEYHGFGLMQVDIGTDKAFSTTGAWKDARKTILRGAKILDEKRSFIQRNVGKVFKVTDSKGMSYRITGKPIGGMNLLRCMVAAYNCGGFAYYHFSKNRDPDYGTTGKNYGADVLSREPMFRALLEADGYLKAKSARKAAAKPAAAAAATTAVVVDEQVESADVAPDEPSDLEMATELADCVESRKDLVRKVAPKAGLGSSITVSFLSLSLGWRIAIIVFAATMTGFLVYYLIRNRKRLFMKIRGWLRILKGGDR